MSSFFPLISQWFPLSTTIKKPPKSEDLSVFSWSCYPDLNWGPHPYQAPQELFSNYFSCFIAIYAPIRLLSVTLWASCLHILHTALWLKMWSKTPHGFCWKWFPGWCGEHFYIPVYPFAGERAERGKWSLRHPQLRIYGAINKRNPALLRHRGTGRVRIEPAHQPDSDWRGQKGGRPKGAGSQNRL